MKIGQGLQFIVYGKGNKVEKVPTSKSQIKRKLLFWKPSYLFKPLTLEKEAQCVIKERNQVIKDLKKRRIKPSLFANLHFGKNKIEQDKVRPLGKRLRNYDEACKLIDKYIDFIFTCWKHGFSERTYNLTINNGINEKGAIVLIDFGEITFNKENVKKAIQTQRWRKSWSFKRDLSLKVKNYYNKEMGKRMTLFNLNKHWGKRK